MVLLSPLLSPQMPSISHRKIYKTKARAAKTSSASLVSRINNLFAPLLSLAHLSCVSTTETQLRKSSISLTRLHTKEQQQKRLRLWNSSRRRNNT